MLQCSSNKILQKEYNGSDGIILGESVNIESFKFDRYNLNDIKVAGDSLVINLSYSGGCRDHEFALIAEEYFVESPKIETKLILSHISNFDPCEQYITKDYTFNLLPLKYKYIETYGNETGSIRLVLEEQKVEYKF